MAHSQQAEFVGIVPHERYRSIDRIVVNVASVSYVWIGKNESLGDVAMHIYVIGSNEPIYAAINENQQFMSILERLLKT
jgi:hypothetical protein